MKKLFVLLSIFLFVQFIGDAFAQISWSGDFQIRPRYDIKNWRSYGDPNGIEKNNDMYYLLKATLDLGADIGDGFFAKTRLEHYGVAGYAWTNRLLNDAPPPLANSNDLMGRPTVNFNLLYFGIHKKNWGIEGGIIPINGLANPLLDIHYMPLMMVDIPFLLYRLNSLIGVQGYFAAGPGKINYFVSLDQNNDYKEATTGDVISDKHDTYTFGVDYSFKISGFWFQPVVFITWASDSIAAPISYGLNLSTPEFSGITLGGSAVFSNQSKDYTKEYDAYLFRFKVDAKFGPGSLQAWFDIAKRTDKLITDIEHDFTYLWLMYKFPIYNSEHGSVSITPRWRHITEKVDNAMDFSREKIECLFSISFK